ncbi:MAG: DUF3226 domain-containing protein [Pseudomonadota bacterium]
MIRQNKKLLVEGKDDAIVINRLIRSHSVTDNFSIEEKNGIENLLRSLPVHIKESGLNCLGIVVDADMDVSVRWGQISKILVDSGYNPPTTPDSAGLILSELNRPKVGIWLMPDNNTCGMLEDFVKLLIPKDDYLFPIAKEAVFKIPVEYNKFREHHKSKAEIHTWLAWQEDPGTPMGLALTKRYLDSKSLHALTFLGWISRLFG